MSVVLKIGSRALQNGAAASLLGCPSGVIQDALGRQSRTLAQATVIAPHVRDLERAGRGLSSLRDFPYRQVLC